MSKIVFLQVNVSTVLLSALIIYSLVPVESLACSSFSGVDKIVGYALSHQLKNSTSPTSGKDVRVVLSGERYSLNFYRMHYYARKACFQFYLVAAVLMLAKLQP